MGVARHEHPGATLRAARIASDWPTVQRDAEAAVQAMVDSLGMGDTAGTRTVAMPERARAEAERMADQRVVIDRRRRHRDARAR